MEWLFKHVYSFIFLKTKDTLTWFRQQTAFSEEARANTMFLGKTLDYTAQRLEESVRKFLLREDGLFSGFVNKCEVLNVFL